MSCWMMLASLASAVAASPGGQSRGNNISFPELLAYDPVADPAAVVTSGRFRATVLTDRLVRLEWSATKDNATKDAAEAPSEAAFEAAAFEDRATTAFLHRKLPVPKFTAMTTAGGVLEIATSALTVRYTVGQPFSAETLVVVPAVTEKGKKGKKGKGQRKDQRSLAFQGWHFGQRDPQNLLGTIKSLDQLGPTTLNCSLNKNITVHAEDLHCAFGLVSRAGWALVDDADSYALDERGWWQAPNADAHDLYLFAHGHDYKAALQDFVSVSGKVAMAPRAALGVWWTRWFNINAPEARGIVDDYRSRALPLDVFVLDMDWHVKPAWGSYSFDRNLFPDPADTLLDYVKGHEGLITLANLHDDNGVVAGEDEHDAMAAQMGLVPPASTQDIPFEICSNPAYAQALEDAVLLPLEKQGLDYWWIDWQQGGNHGGCKGLAQNPTIWTNKIRATDHIRRGSDKRGLLLARWGGLGSHRYQVGFSGDVLGVNWASLAYQPYFSMTASNVAYGFWSHDIVGPSGSNTNDLELYTRWLQWASYSGVLRSHDRGSSAGGCAGPYPATLTSNTCTVVKPWNVPSRYFEANRASLQRRTAFTPYTYTLARAAYDTGLGPLRPMYYEFPTLDMAYAAKMDGSNNQYFFGDDMIVAPVVAPASNTTYMAQKSWWIAPGSWIEETSGRVFNGAKDGSTTASRSYALDEVPVLIKAGAVLPTVPLRMGDTIGVAGRQYDALVLTVMPGATTGTTSIYEDDGSTTAYVKGASATTTVSYARTQKDQVVTVTIATQGAYAELPLTRLVTLKLVHGAPVASVKIDRKSVPFPYSRYGDAAQTWTYDGEDAATVLHLPAHQVATGTTIEVTFAPDAVASMALLAGVKGMARRGTAAKAELDLVRTTPGAHESGFGALDRLAILGDDLGRLAGKSDLTGWTGAVAGAAKRLEDAVSEVKAMKQDGARTEHVLALLDF